MYLTLSFSRNSGPVLGTFCVLISTNRQILWQRHFKKWFSLSFLTTSLGEDKMTAQKSGPARVTRQKNKAIFFIWFSVIINSEIHEHRMDLRTFQWTRSPFGLCLKAS